MTIRQHELPANAIAPQPGVQTKFCAAGADVVIYGGTAGGGKTRGLVLKAARYVDHSAHAAVLFRRTYAEAKKANAIWDQTVEVYSQLGARINSVEHTHVFRSGARIELGQMLDAKDSLKYQSPAYTFVGFDEVTQIRESHFWWMVGRLRSAAASQGIRSQLAATCNPDPDSFVRNLVAWYIGEDGYAIPERSGKVRWFVRANDGSLLWADSRQGLADRGADPKDAMSFQFILARPTDNPALFANDPGYLRRLKMLPRVDRMRMLGEGDGDRGGNWDVRAAAGLYFRDDILPIIGPGDLPGGSYKEVRYWDRGATEVSSVSPDPSWTAGIRARWYPEQELFVVVDVVRDRLNPSGVAEFIDATAERDGREVMVGIEQDPAQAGKAEARAHATRLAGKGFTVKLNPVRESKGARAGPVATQAEAGNVALLRGSWNKDYRMEAENFDGTDRGHADQVDATSGAYFVLVSGRGQIRSVGKKDSLMPVSVTGENYWAGA